MSTTTRPTRAALLAACAAIGFGMAACQPAEGPAERAGKAIDNTAEKAADSIEQAGDKVKDAVNDAKK
jgi:hypothetical protein